ncbi:MAG: YihY/virulence factor BrkB family protein [Planctomycetes bacterium]|nr:YihY/virulence factor BrkB family protein [Planctomycetota bacterium]
MFSKTAAFFKTEIWRLRLSDYSRPTVFFIRQAQVIALAGRRFGEDKCKFRAAALTYHSLLSIVPLLAMIFGIAKGFGLEELVEGQVKAWFSDQHEVAEKTIGFANSLLEDARGGLVATIGLIIMFWTIVKVLGDIEDSFNAIWGVKRARTIGRKFSDYLSIVLVCPVLLVLSSSLTVIVNSQVQVLADRISTVTPLGPAVLLPLKLIPYATIWASFTFIFIFMPNTKVKFRAGVIGGIIAGTVFQFSQWTYIHFQIGVAKSGAIYGSFAALPLFMIWLHISWLIVLFGAEITFAVQNVKIYEFDQDCLEISPSFKRLLSLLITQHIVKQFCAGQGACDAARVSRKLEIPIRLVRKILYELVEAEVLAEVVKPEEDRETGYQPARDVDAVTIKYVVDALDGQGSSNIPVMPSEELDKLSGYLADLGSVLEKAPANVALKAI